MKKLFGVVITVIVLVSIIILSDKDNHTIKSVSYNGDNLRISIDGVSSDALPTSGNYYLVDYDCSSVNTKLSWDKDNYELDVTNGGKEGSYSCYLNFSSKMPLSKVEPGSYVAYTGNNGCVGDYCSGVNANSSDTSNGYCYSSTYEFIESGWRVAYTDEGSAYIVSAGAPECLCTNSDGTTSNSSCSSYEKTNGAPLHIENLNNAALKYCNTSYIKNGVCDNKTARIINADDFQKITESTLSSCYDYDANVSSRRCGLFNEIIDNGGYYWYGTPYDSASSNIIFHWNPYARYMNYGISYSVFGVRPVLSLESSVIVTGGKGTKDDPYTIGNNAFILDNSNIYVSDKSSVGLRMISVGDASSMCISVNTSGCDNYIDYADSYTMDWSSYEDGDYTVYAYYKNSDGELIASMSRSIILDKTAPSNNSVSIGDASGLSRTLTLSSEGADYMCISNTSSDVSDCTDWVDYASSYDWRLTGGEGEKTVYAFFKDKAGNIGEVASDTITYTIECLGVDEVYALSYTGAVVNSGELEVKICAGTYTMQVWGAQGGNTGGKGGYSTGDITLAGTETLYFYVGGAGALGTAGFNGGGGAGDNGGAGGGATDVRVNTDSLYARVIVAGGGGGKGRDSCAAGAVGGGTTGGGGASQSSCGTQAGGGTQTAGGAVGVYSSTLGANAGAFGVGGTASDGSWDGGGGGGGWYGGGAGSTGGYSNGGGGGSGFVFTADSTLPDGYLLGSTYYLANASTTDGAQSTIPTTDGTGTETGHSGNGYIKITRLS